MNHLLAKVVEIPNPLGAGTTIAGLIDRIATWLLEIGLLVSTLIVLWSAFLFITSGGSKDQVTKARQTLLYAVVGIAVLLLAKSVAYIVKDVIF